MFYEAVAGDGARSIGAAVSRDGLRSWRRLPAPVLAAGAPGAWDAGGVGAPCAVPMAGDAPCLWGQTLGNPKTSGDCRGRPADVRMSACWAAACRALGRGGRAWGIRN